MVVVEQLRDLERSNYTTLLTNLKSMKFNFFLFFFLYVVLISSFNKCSVHGQETANNDDAKEPIEITPPPKQLTCDFGTSQELNAFNFEPKIDEINPNIKWKLGYGATLGGPPRDHTSNETTGGYFYLDTSYKLVNKIYSTASLESGDRPIFNVNSNNEHFPPSPAYTAKFSSVQSSNHHNNNDVRNKQLSFASFANQHSSSLSSNNVNSKFTPNNLAYEKKFIQELWHSNPNDHQMRNSRNILSNGNYNLTSHYHLSRNMATGNRNQTIPFHNVLNNHQHQQHQPHQQQQQQHQRSSDHSNGTVYKQQLIAISDLFNTQIEPVPNSASILSPNISDTGPMGNCVRFYYSMDGLSAEKLRVLVLDLETNENQTLYETSKQTEKDEWVKIEIAYAHDKMHKLVIEGITKPFDVPERSYRGSVAFDDFSYAFVTEDSASSGMCHGHCTFDGGLCGWTNIADEDDFDWIQGKGSDSIYTGPSRDYRSFTREFSQGGYLYIDASYPRRPGDRAMLKSPQFPANTVSTSSPNVDLEKQENNGPLCLKFATHMFGNGIGTLRVKVRPAEEGGDAGSTPEEAGKNDKILWEMTGEAGNRWHLAQLSYASTTPYNFIFEGVVGPNYLGNIAIDNILIEQGACPISPQIASRKSGDCTFEESMCSWTNAHAISGLDHFDWSRRFSYGTYGPKNDHTRVSTNGYFMSLSGDNVLQRGGTYAWLVSPQLDSLKQANSIGKCMSFYYFMYQRAIEQSGPSLGGLRINIRTMDAQGSVVLLPIWRLNNHQSTSWRQGQILIRNDLFPMPNNAIYQVVIEGVWGDARVGAIAFDDITFFDVSEDASLCKTLPPNAASIKGECSFDRNDLCGWKNDTLNIDGKSTNTKSDSSSFSKGLSIPNRLDSNSGLNGNDQSPLSLNNLHLFTRSNVRPIVSWKLATPNSRPSNLQDHTFSAPIGYIYFDVFNQQYMQKPTLRSAKLPASTNDEGPKSRCLSFWFKAFGRGENSILSVYLMKIEDTGESSDSGGSSPAPTSNTDKKDENTSGEEKPENNKILLWKIESKLIQSRRNVWDYAQTSVNAETDHHVIFEGEAKDGGFALDDITFYNGTCETRPALAAVKMKTEGET